MLQEANIEELFIENSEENGFGLRVLPDLLELEKKYNQDIAHDICAHGVAQLPDTKTYLNAVSHKIPYISFLLEHGKEGDVNVYSWNQSPMEKGNCYGNCYSLLKQHHDSKPILYVEGFALTINGLKPHAWIDYEGYVLDPTWPWAKDSCKYFGISCPWFVIQCNEKNVKTDLPLFDFGHWEFNEKKLKNYVNNKKAEQ